MGEKSRKTRLCDAKLGNYRRFLGERHSRPERGTPIIKDLRAPQATRTPIAHVAGTIVEVG
jgi:hypothetical protein